MSVTPVTVTGNVKDAGLQVVRGAKIVFALSHELRNSGDGVVITPEPVEAVIEADGTFTVNLVALDDGDTIVNENAYYKVSVHGPESTYHFATTITVSMAPTINWLSLSRNEVVSTVLAASYATSQEVAAAMAAITTHLSGHPGTQLPSPTGPEAGYFVKVNGSGDGYEIVEVTPGSVTEGDVRGVGGVMTSASAPGGTQTISDVLAMAGGLVEFLSDAGIAATRAEEGIKFFTRNLAGDSWVERLTIPPGDSPDLQVSNSDLLIEGSRVVTLADGPLIRSAPRSPIIVSDENFDLLASHNFEVLVCDFSTLVTVTIQDILTESYVDGQQTTLVAAGAGGLTVDTSAVSLVGSGAPERTIAVDEAITLVKMAEADDTNTWIILGGTA